MQLFIVDAFTDTIFSGNQAGVVLLSDDQAFPDDILMQKIAAELKHSETAFVKRLNRQSFQLRYFTPEGEVPLCGHATVSAFTVLREEKQLMCGQYQARTSAGELNVSVESNKIWLEMPRGEFIKTLTAQEAARLYQAYHLDLTDCPADMQPCIVKSGLADVLVPVSRKEALDCAKQNRDEVIAISKEQNLVGVHMFYCPQSGEPTAYCRNFAPLFGIDEESATGTSNAALTHYLFLKQKIEKNAVNLFVQGEAMGKPSQIWSKVNEDGGIQIGGNAVISVKGTIEVT